MISQNKFWATKDPKGLANPSGLFLHNKDDAPRLHTLQILQRPQSRQRCFVRPEHGQHIGRVRSRGCGKSTLLALIAGLIAPDEGDVLWDHNRSRGRRLTSAAGLMFQDYALFPHLNVGDNVGFGYRRPTRFPKPRRSIERVGLKGFEKRDVQTLSGGEHNESRLPAPARAHDC